MTLSLRPDQIEDLSFYMKNERCANLSDPGTGKTPSVCVYIYYLSSRKDKKSFWVMPKSLLAKNKMELLRFTEFTEDQIIIVDGTPKQREAQMSDPRGKVFLMGFKRFSDDWETLLKYHPELDAVIVDEIHMGFKSDKSTRTKELFKAMRKMRHFLAMSGTLIDGRLDSAYPTIKIIEPRYYTNHNSFIAQHALVDEYGQIFEWVNHAKIGRIFKRHCVRRSFESVHGKVKKVIECQPCEMSKAQRAAYDEFEAMAILELEDGFIEGGNPAVAAIRCRQILAHPETFGLLPKGEMSGKDEALLVHLEDHKNNKQPLVIFSVLQPEQERIYKLCKDMGFRVGLINGNVSAKDRAKIDEQFQNGELDIVVGSPATAAVGFNWSHVNHIIFASLDYLNSNFVQAIQRAIRGTRKIPLRVTVLEYLNSIEQRIFQIVNKKSKDLNKVDDTYETLDLGYKDIEE